jgi:hypothetical protein
MLPGILPSFARLAGDQPDAPLTVETARRRSRCLFTRSLFKSGDALTMIHADVDEMADERVEFFKPFINLAEALIVHPHSHQNQKTGNKGRQEKRHVLGYVHSVFSMRLICR